MVEPLALATWNLLHGVRVGPRTGDGAAPGEVDPAALSESVAALDVDVLGLQEVDRHQERSGGSDQTALAAEALGAPWWRFVASVSGTPGPGATWDPVDHDGPVDGPAYGVGLVSRRPVLEWHVLRFPAARGSLPLLVPGHGLVRIPDEPRVAIAAVVDAGPVGGQPLPVTVATCHLSFLPGVNLRQLRRTCAWLRRLPGPRLLVGDLNLPGRLPGTVSRWRQLARVATYPSWRPRVQWDHALADALAPTAAVTATTVVSTVSDHRALRVVVDGP